MTRDILERIKKFSAGSPQGPVILELYPTWRCNSKCIACLIPENQKDIPVEVPAERYIEIIREAAELGVHIVYILGGGEPLCRPELIYDLVDNIKRHNLKGMLTTNGIVFPEHLARNMVEMKWDFLHFSVDGPDKYVHDELRGVKGAFEKVMNAIQLLNSWKKKLSTNKPSLEFNTVLSVKNYHLLPQILQLAKDNFIDFISFLPVYINAERMQALSLDNLDQDKLLTSLREAKEVGMRLSVNSNIDDLLNSYFCRQNTNAQALSQEAKSGLTSPGGAPERAKHIPDSYCLKPWYHLVIQASGEVGPCCNFQENKCNILDKSLKDIWFGEYFNNLRKLMVDNNPPGNCSRCAKTLQDGVNRELVEKLKNSIN